MKRYDGIDWLRALGCLGIAAMHMRASNQYAISGFIYDRVINSFTDFVFLFMAVSAFGMCCGYYERVMNESFDWPGFYRKRYARILPFFALLIVIDLIHSFSIKSLSEGIVEATLMHGFVPQRLEVIGVGWFLGIVFVFYLIFPFFCAVISNKRLAWFTMLVAVIMNLICIHHFGLDRHNFLVCSCFFVTGGLLFVYKDRIAAVKWQYLFVIMLVSVVAYYCNVNVITRVLVTASILAFATNAPLPRVKVISLISGISMEIYLSHMLIFRGLEKLHFNDLLGDGVLQYCFTVVMVFAGACVFSYFAQLVIHKLLRIVCDTRKK